LEDRVFKAVAHEPNVRFALRQKFDSSLGRFSQTGYRRNVFRSTAAPVFLTPASDQWVKASSPINVKRADALRPMKFVRG
jgi:hypothetical protein